MERGEALLEADRCLYCVDAPCIPACPTGIDIPTFIRKIGSGNLSGSARTILKSNLLGASCARVCPVEVLCEGACVMNRWGKRPIQIGRLQRHAMQHGARPDLLPRAPRSGFSVGLVGTGPASLACGGALTLLGHEAVLYERSALPGGLNTSGVAPYKMDAGSAMAEIAFLVDLGVEIRSGVEIGRDLTGADLLSRHDAVFLGPGLGGDTPLGVPGEEGPGVVGAVAWIADLKTRPGVSVEGVRRAVVVGGGNTALDACRELAQLGVAEVRLVYRRTEAEMKGYRHEWRAARNEGVALVPEAVVTEVVREDGRPALVRLVRARDGKPTGEPLPPLPVDLVVVAIGQAGLRRLVAEFPGVEMDRAERIVADAGTGRTGNPRVWAGGDARNGGREVVHAVAEGQRAARSIHGVLSGGD
jgi:glutamate synthase (NADPH/NADH) small chain